MWVDIDEFPSSGTFQKMCKSQVKKINLTEAKHGEVFYLREIRKQRATDILVQDTRKSFVIISNFHDYHINQQDLDYFCSLPGVAHLFSVNLVGQNEKATQIMLGIKDIWMKVKKAAEITKQDFMFFEEQVYAGGELKEAVLESNESSKVAIKKASELHKNRDILCYANFKAHVGHRIPILNWCKSQSFITNVDWDKRKEQEYFNDLTRSRFVISPPGNGMDCYRTWEALACGAIPIVKKSFLAPLYEGLPILQVESFEEITPDLLENFVPDVSRLEKLTTSYWKAKVNEVASNG